MLTFVAENNLISPNESELRLGGCCVNQLIANPDEIHKSFDEEFKVRGILLNIYLKFSIRYGMKVHFSN